MHLRVEPGSVEPRQAFMAQVAQGVIDAADGCVPLGSVGAGDMNELVLGIAFDGVKPQFL